MKYDDYSFDQSTYQRPGQRHRCGRSRFWKKTCWQGPDKKGACGGTSECQPALRDNGYVCTRPVHAGGVCTQGPDQHGNCCNTHPPCQPRLNFKVWRGRLSVFAVLLVIGLLAAFSNDPLQLLNGKSQNDLNFSGPMMMPGPVSDEHRVFTGEHRCGTCHIAHDEGLKGWFMAAFAPQKLSEGCLSCHSFEGEAMAPHQDQQHGEKLGEITCTACHTEHQGRNGELTTVTNMTCSNCHEKQFSDFKTGHPEFATDYPHAIPQTLYFNHQRHVNEYFVENKWLDKPNRDREFGEKAAKDCTVCHAVEGATLDVKPIGYDTMCAGCHNQQLQERQLIVMTASEVTPVLLGLQDAESNAEAMEQDTEELAAELLQKMAEAGLQPLADISGERAMSLWKGMNALEVQKAAIEWLEESDYEALMEEQQSAPGWHVGETIDGDQAVFYSAAGHADPVLKEWIETYITNRAMGDESVEEALETLLDIKQGPGACAKCHIRGITEVLHKQQEGHALEQSDIVFDWGYLQREGQPTTRYHHASHVDLMGDTPGCEGCHELKPKVDFDAYFKALPGESATWNAAFKSIEKKTCESCHSENRISADCLTCHVYHQGQGYRLGFMDTASLPEAEDEQK